MVSSSDHLKLLEVQGLKFVKESSKIKGDVLVVVMIKHHSLNHFNGSGFWSLTFKDFTHLCQKKSNPSF